MSLLEQYKAKFGRRPCLNTVRVFFDYACGNPPAEQRDYRQPHFDFEANGGFHPLTGSKPEKQTTGYLGPMLLMQMERLWHGKPTCFQSVMFRLDREQAEEVVKAALEEREAILLLRSDGGLRVFTGHEPEAGGKSPLDAEEQFVLHVLGLVTNWHTAEQVAEHIGCKGSFPTARVEMILEMLAKGGHAREHQGKYTANPYISVL